MSNRVPLRAFHYHDGKVSQTLMGFRSLTTVKRSSDKPTLLLGQTQEKNHMVGLDLQGEVKFRATLPTDHRLEEVEYQPQVDRVCFRLGDAIEVHEALSGKRLARLTPHGLENLSELVGLADGRFAIDTRDQKTPAWSPPLTPSGGVRRRSPISTSCRWN